MPKPKLIAKSLSHLKPWSLLPAAPGTCQECATKHEPYEPHNQQSLFYQYRFYDQNGRWPLWSDAMAHCSSLVRAAWKRELEKRGITVSASSKTTETLS